MCSQLSFLPLFLALLITYLPFPADNIRTGAAVATSEEMSTRDGNKSRAHDDFHTIGNWAILFTPVYFPLPH